MESKESKIGIVYALCHPETHEVRYIGRTTDPAMRKSRHLNPDVGFGKKRNSWVEELAEEGMRPVMIALHECPAEELQMWESRLFAEYLLKGARLTNGQTMNRGGGYRQFKIHDSQGRQIEEMAERRGITFSMMGRVLIDFALSQFNAQSSGVFLAFDDDASKEV